MTKTPLRLATLSTATAAVTEAPPAFSDTLVRLQGMQLALLLSWQNALVAMQNELWDEWACRWAGGVPIDV